MAKQSHMWSLLALAALVGGVPLFSCFVLSSLLSLDGFISITSGGTTTPEIEAKLGITLPPSAVIQYVERDGFLDEYINLKLEVDQGDLAAFLADSPFVDAKLSSNQRYVFQCDASPPEWRPEEARSFESAEVDLPGNEVIRILIDHDTPARPVIYIEWFES